MPTLISRTACVRLHCKFGVERHVTISVTPFLSFFFFFSINWQRRLIPQRRELSAPPLTCWPCSPGLLMSDWTVNVGLKGMSGSGPGRHLASYFIVFCKSDNLSSITSNICHSLTDKFSFLISVLIIINYSDDSAIEDLSNSDSVYFGEVERFSNWCRDNSLYLNVKKKRKCWLISEKLHLSFQIFLDGVKAERVTECKYLWTVSDKLNFNKNIDFIHKRWQPWIFCLQKLRSLNVSAAVLRIFYWSRTESVSTFWFLCWFGGLNVKSKKIMSWIKWWLCVARLWVSSTK